jgi:hypothetical protein
MSGEKLVRLAQQREQQEERYYDDSAACCDYCQLTRIKIIQH